MIDRGLVGEHGLTALKAWGFGLASTAQCLKAQAARKGFCTPGTGSIESRQVSATGVAQVNQPRSMVAAWITAQATDRRHKN